MADLDSLDADNATTDSLNAGNMTMATLDMDSATSARPESAADEKTSEISDDKVQSDGCQLPIIFEISDTDATCTELKEALHKHP